MTPGVATPGDVQVRAFPLTLAHPCPTCHAAAGDPCLPTSLSVPHVARVGLLDTETGAVARVHAELALAAAIRGVDQQVWSVSYAESDDAQGSLYVTDVDCGPRGRYHPDDPAFERVAQADAVRDALRQLTAAGGGTDHLVVRPR